MSRRRDRVLGEITANESMLLVVGGTVVSTRAAVFTESDWTRRCGAEGDVQKTELRVAVAVETDPYRRLHRIRLLACDRLLPC